MNIETTCANCGSEHDLRHVDCPACTVDIEMRSARPPYDTWRARGYFSFEKFGELFAVTRVPCTLAAHTQWRVSHVATGAALPYTQADTKEESKQKAIALLDGHGEAKFKQSCAKLREMVATTRGAAS